MKPDFLKIDQLRLDQEWLHQPRLYFEMAQELADAQLEQNRADSDLKLVAAELDLAIRENPAKFKLPDKPLEAAIKSAVLKSKSYFERQELLFKTKHRVDVLQAAVVALEHRKRSLTLLVQLHLANYFSDPKSRWAVIAPGRA